MKTLLHNIIKLNVVALFLAAPVAMADVVRIAVIDPLTGPFAALGENQFKSWEFLGESANKAKWAAVAMLSKAIKESKSVEPLKVALALEGMKATSLNGDVVMRAADHRWQQPLYIATWSKLMAMT